MSKLYVQKETVRNILSSCTVTIIHSFFSFFLTFFALICYVTFLIIQTHFTNSIQGETGVLMPLLQFSNDCYIWWRSKISGNVLFRSIARYAATGNNRFIEDTKTTAIQTMESVFLPSAEDKENNEKDVLWHFQTFPRFPACQ